MIKAVIFDMDGTILNTLEDLADAINYALQKRGHRCDFDLNIVRMFFGSGIRVAFERAIAMSCGCPVEKLEIIGTDSYHGEFAPKEYNLNEEIDELMKIYLPFYNEHCNDKTGAYDGIYEVLEALREKNIKTAVVSNKPDSAVKILCETLFKGKFDFNLGEIPGVPRKPDRAMLDAAIKALNVSIEETIYVGDSEIDLLTAKNAKMDCIAVTWGFRSREFLKKHGAETIIDRPMEIMTYS